MLTPNEMYVCTNLIAKTNITLADVEIETMSTVDIENMELELLLE
jgi:hypothetical protein